MKKLVLTPILFLFTLLSYSQLKPQHIVYLSNLENGIINTNDFKEISHDNTVSNFHVLLVNNNISITYSEKASMTIVDTVGNIISQKYNIDVFNKKKQAYTRLNYISTLDTAYFSKPKKTVWNKVDEEYLQNKYNISDSEKEFLKHFNTNPDDRNYELSFISKNKSKEIFDINCFSGNLKVFSNCDKTTSKEYPHCKLNVWFTEDINLNWSFNNYFSIIPGTIIKAYIDDTTVFELKQQYNELIYKNTMFTKEQINEILKSVS